MDQELQNQPQQESVPQQSQPNLTQPPAVKKSKTGLYVVIGIIVFVLLVVGISMAILLSKPKSTPQPVPQAQTNRTDNQPSCDSMTIECGAQKALGSDDTRAHTSTAATNAETVQKKAEAYNAIIGNYPKTTDDFNSQPDSSLDGSGINVISTLPTTTNYQSIYYKYCSDTGAQIVYYDSTAGATKLIALGDASDSTLCK